MGISLGEFLVQLDQGRKLLNNVSGAQVHADSTRATLRNLAQDYFKQVRPSCIDDAMQDERIKSIDADMQALVELCHVRGSVGKYKTLLARARKELVSLDSRLVAAVPQLRVPPSNESVDVKIIQTLKSIVPSAALSYEQALNDLKQVDRLSWRGPATDLREALRETLDKLAPDTDVTTSAGFKLEPNATGPTMKQKVRFILKNRGASKNSAAPIEDATATIDELLGSFVRSIYTRSNISTHTPTNRSEVLRVRDLVRVAMSELLEISN